MAIRQATPDDRLAVMRLLDAAVLVADADTVTQRIRAGDVLLHEGDGPPAGVLVLEDRTVTAIAVRPERRDQGIGRRLITAARDQRGSLTAEFDARVRPFYESLGFDITPLEDGSGRFRGTIE